MPSEDEIRDLVVTRVFAAPLQLVWHAWSDPEHVMRWWGPQGFSSPRCVMDFREGGTTLVCMRSSQGGDLYNTWAYQTIQPMYRIEFIQNFADEEGRRVAPVELGLPPGVPEDVRHVVTFTAIDEATTEMTVTEHGYGSEQILEVSRTGLEQCLDKMAASFIPG